jgi:hypothetical protein
MFIIYLSSVYHLCIICVSSVYLLRLVVFRVIHVETSDPWKTQRPKALPFLVRSQIWEPREPPRVDFQKSADARDDSMGPSPRARSSSGSAEAARSA